MVIIYFEVLGGVGLCMWYCSLDLDKIKTKGNTHGRLKSDSDYQAPLPRVAVGGS